MPSALAAYLWGRTDARPVALFRIVFGLALLLDSIDRLFDVRSLYSDEGFLPRALARASCNGNIPLARLLGAPASGRMFIAVGILVTVAFIVGFYGRVCAALLWIYMVTLATRNCFAADGGDEVMMVLLGWSIFMDLDGVWSVRRRGRSLVPALPVRVAEAQVGLIYLVAGLSKSGPLWHHGRALFTILQLNIFARPLGMTLIQWPRLCALLTFGTLIVELSFLPLALAPWGAARRITRPIALVSAALLHLGILLLMRVGMFSYVMWGCLALFVPAGWLGTEAAPPRTTSSLWVRPWQRVIGALLVVQLLAVVVSLVTRDNPPAPLIAELRLVHLAQDWTMFSPDPPDADVYWTARATLADGQVVDGLAPVPGMLPQAPLRFSRWYKVRDTMPHLPSLQVLLLRFICRQPLAAQPLVDVHLQLWQRPTYAPGESPHAFALGFDHVWRCR